MIDLHTHSSMSDGSDPPERIPELAAAAGCSAVALTDHDTLAGLAGAHREASRLGLTLVPGCEVSCRKPPPAPDGTTATGGLHMLVYFVDEGRGPLPELLAALQRDRVERNHRLVERLVVLGIPVSYESVVARAGREGGVGRPHFARELVAIGAAEDVDDAFERWLGDDRPAYVPKGRVSAGEVVEVAHASGGVAVLAHPLTLGLPARTLDVLVGDLAAQGMAGIETLHSSHTRGQRADLLTLAARHGLVATGGSDYHGDLRPGLSVGTGRGDLDVPSTVLAELEERRP